MIALLPILGMILAASVALIFNAADGRETTIAALLMVAVALPNLTALLPLPSRVATLVAAGASVWRITAGGFAILLTIDAHRSAAVAVIAGVLTLTIVDLALRVRALVREPSRA